MILLVVASERGTAQTLNVSVCLQTDKLTGENI